MICVNPINYYNMITLKIYFSMHNFCVLILGKWTAQKGWNNDMETYHSLQLDSLLQTYCFHVLKKKFKPLSKPQSLNFLALLLNIESRRKKKKTFFLIITSLSESRCISSLWKCVRN